MALDGIEVAYFEFGLEGLLFLLHLAGLSNGKSLPQLIAVRSIALGTVRLDA